MFFRYITFTCMPRNHNVICIHVSIIYEKNSTFLGLKVKKFLSMGSFMKQIHKDLLFYFLLYFIFILSWMLISLVFLKCIRITIKKNHHKYLMISLIKKLCCLDKKKLSKNNVQLRKICLVKKIK